jgi:putative PIN family toxin of toxin-antitoxin system
LASAILDPGVLVSAAIAPHGVCGRLLQSALDQQFELIACPLLLNELEEVLLRPKFRRYLTEEQARDYAALVAGVVEEHSDPAVEAGATADPDDDYLVALARASGADYLISGDAHLLAVAVDDLKILSPRNFVETLVLGGSWFTEPRL